MKTNIIQNNFSNGEISPTVVARNDIPLYKQVAEWIQNFICLPQGALVYRYGTSYVHHTRNNAFAVLIPFDFNDLQSYIIEATAGWFRFYTRDGAITETGVAITAITNSVPGVITAPAHGYTVGQEFFVNNVQGMEGINGQAFIVSGATVNTIVLADVFGNPVDTTGFGTYTSGGTVSRIYEVATPYTQDHLEQLQTAQNADGMYVVHRKYEPRLLLRLAQTNWTFGTYVRTPDPFASAGNWPGAVGFTPDIRLVMAGTDNNPDVIWGSRTPVAAGNRFDNFDDGGASPLATSSYRYTLAPILGKVDDIRWISNTNKYLIIGTLGSVRNMYGASQDSAPTPLAVNVKAISPFGAMLTTPAPDGAEIFYAQRDGKNIRALNYSFDIQDYESTDKNLVSLHVTRSGIRKIVRQQGNPQILWAVRNDGRLMGLTYNDKENKYGWHRQYLAGAQVESIGIMPRNQLTDQLWMVCKRTVDGQTVRHIELMTDSVEFPELLDFTTGRDRASEIADAARYNNALYEKQKDAIQLDASIVYDGSTLSDTVSITPGAGSDVVDATSITFTASASFFTAAMVGREIWKKYDETGVGGGRARIDSYTDATHVSCTILSGFNNTDAIPPGSWFLTTDELSGLGHLEGQTVGVVKDGSVHTSRVVQNGAITLDSQGSKIVVGLTYQGVIKTVALDQGGQTGPGITKIKNMKEFYIRLLNSGGLSFGTSLYALQDIVFDSTGRVTGRPVPLYTGIKQDAYEDTNEREKHLYLVQDKSIPCTILSVEPYTMTTEKG